MDAKVAFSAAAILLGTLALSPLAASCPWDNETYVAEAKSLPCVFDAVLGT